MILINLYGGPGTGKSTTATGLFSQMKLQGFKCEYVSEYAKDVVWDRSFDLLHNQLLIFANQYHRIQRLESHGVDYVITDSPLLLSLNYMPENYFASFKGLVKEAYQSFNNFDVFLNRVKPYQPIGRRHAEESAKDMDRTIHDILLEHVPTFHNVEADFHAASTIFKILR